MVKKLFSAFPDSGWIHHPIGIGEGGIPDEKGLAASHKVTMFSYLLLKLAKLPIMCGISLHTSVCSKKPSILSPHLP